MNIDTLHLMLFDKLYDDLVRIALLLKHVPEDTLGIYYQDAVEVDPEHAGCANDVRKLWGRRLNGLRWLLMHVPRDRFIVAHAPSPESNDCVEMSVELMRELAAEARSVEHFFSLCEEACRDYDRDPTECYVKKRHGSQETRDGEASQRDSQAPTSHANSSCEKSAGEMKGQLYV